MSLAHAPRQYTGVRAFNPPTLQLATRAPTSSDTQYVKGTLWLDTDGLASYQWPGSGSWIALGAGAVGGVVTLTGGSGGAISPAAGNITLAGTANQITTTGAGSTITWALSSTLVAPGSIVATTTLESTTTTTVGTGLTVTDGGILVSGGDIINTHSDAAADVTIEVTNSDNTSGSSRSGVEIATGGSSSGDPYLSFQISGVGASTMTMGLDNSASDLFVISNSTAIGTSNALTLSQAGALTATTSITATLGAITATNGNLVLGTAGNKISIATGANGTVGTTGAMTGGAVTENNSSVTTNSKIFAYPAALGTVSVPQAYYVSAIVNGVSFTLTSQDATDTSTWNYWIIN